MPLLKSKGNGEQRGAPSLDTVTHGCRLILARCAPLPGHPFPPTPHHLSRGMRPEQEMRKREGHRQACSPATSVFTQLCTCVKNF